MHLVNAPDVWLPCLRAVIPFNIPDILLWVQVENHLRSCTSPLEHVGTSSGMHMWKRLASCKAVIGGWKKNTNAYKVGA